MLSHQKSVSRQSSPSPISTVLTTNMSPNELYHNNTNSLRRGQSTGYGKLQKLSLESVPEQTMCSVPSHQCSIDYGLSDCQQELELNNIRVPVCIERNQIKIWDKQTKQIQYWRLKFKFKIVINHLEVYSIILELSHYQANFLMS